MPALVRALKRVDLPTLGRPTMPHLRPGRSGARATETDRVGRTAPPEETRDFGRHPSQPPPRAMQHHRDRECLPALIRGAGAAGAWRLALSAQGLSVALGREQAPAWDPDVRAYALNAAAVTLLRELRVWAAPPPEATRPCMTCAWRRRAGRQARFSAWQQGVSELAFIVDAARWTNNWPSPCALRRE